MNAGEDGNQLEPPRQWAVGWPGASEALFARVSEAAHVPPRSANCPPRQLPDTNARSHPEARRRRSAAVPTVLTAGAKRSCCPSTAEK